MSKSNCSKYAQRKLWHTLTNWTLHLKCPSTEVVPELGPVLHLVMSPKFKMCLLNCPPAESSRSKAETALRSHLPPYLPNRAFDVYVFAGGEEFPELVKGGIINRAWFEYSLCY